MIWLENYSFFTINLRVSGGKKEEKRLLFMQSLSVNKASSLKPTVSTLVFPHRSLLSPLWRLKLKSLGPQSAEGSLGYQLSSIVWERHYSRAWYISKAQYCLRSWLPFSKHLSSEIWVDTSKSSVANWHIFSFNWGCFLIVNDAYTNYSSW